MTAATYIISDCLFLDRCTEVEDCGVIHSQGFKDIFFNEVGIRHSAQLLYDQCEQAIRCIAISILCARSEKAAIHVLYSGEYIFICRMTHLQSIGVIIMIN